MRDIDIRRELRADGRLHPGEPDTRIVEELGLCQGVARVDLAVVNGTIHGYEIKSERDTLTRLPGQVAVYSRVLDYVTVVTAPAHADKARGLVPEWWGIWTATNGKRGIRLRELRSAFRNPGVDPFALAQLLWREEALEALIASDLASGMRSKSRKEMWSRLAMELTLDELGGTVRECLKNRAKNWRVAVQRG